LDYIRRRVPAPVDGEKIKALIRQLGDDSFETREKATLALIAVGKPAVPFLQAAVKNPDLEVARRAERCLKAIIKDPTLQAAETTTTIAVIRTLAKKRTAEATEALLSFFSQSSNAEIDREIRFALQIIAKSDGRPDPVLTKALKDKDPRRRQAAAEALGRAPLPPGSRLLLPDVTYPMKGAILRDGKKFMDWEVLDVIFLNHIDDKEFTLP
jgi:HEAT repeat protein